MAIIAAQPYLIAILNFVIAGKPEPSVVDSGEIVEILCMMARGEAMRAAHGQNYVSATWEETLERSSV